MKSPDHNIVSPVTVIVADDHPLVIQGLLDCFNDSSDFSVLGHACTPKGVVDLCQRLTPNVAIIDLVFNHEARPDIPSRIKEVSPKTAVVVCSGFTAAHQVVACFESGGDAYISKDPLGLDPAEAARKASRGEKFLDAQIEIIAGLPQENTGVIPILRETIQHWKSAIEVNQARALLARLTPREIEIVRVRAHSQKDIVAAKLLGLGESDFKNRLHAIRKKLSCSSKEIYATVLLYDRYN